jgi:hypothetical protein
MAQGQITDVKMAMNFILAGKAKMTFVSLASGQRFTYKVTVAEKKQPTDADLWFVSLLNGPDNFRNYAYIGIITKGAFRWTAKSRVKEDAPSLVAFKFVFESLSKDTMRGFEVWHEGKCGRCGRPLTVPQSIADGFGPECVNLVGKPSVAMAAAVGSAAPQAKLNFAGQPIVHGTKQTKIGGYAAAQALYAPAAQTNDAEIDRRVKLYATMMPEEYTQDGVLTDEEAYKITYNRIKQELLKGGK